jgi:hypothetical protein
MKDFIMSFITKNPKNRFCFFNSPFSGTIAVPIPDLVPLSAPVLVDAESLKLAKFAGSNDPGHGLSK